MKRNVGRPGGRYTRPRRGFRTSGGYKRRLKKRHMSPQAVHMESLDVLRRRQSKDPVEAPRIGVRIPSAPFVPANSDQWKGGKASVGHPSE